jgi:hypothetical protein
MTPIRLLPFAAAAFSLTAVAETSRIQATPPTALDRYVAKDDGQFAWKVVSQTPVAGGKFTVIELTSQQWLTAQ